MSESYFQDHGVAYRTSTFAPDRPTLVLIHGLSGSCSAWYAYEAELAMDYNLITLDLLGHGLSRKPAHFGDYALTQSAADVYALLAHLHIEHCTLVSHSYGTLVALELLHAHPDLVERTILLSPNAYLDQTLWYWPTKLFGTFFSKIYDLFARPITSRGRVDYTLYPQSGDWSLGRCSADITNTTLRVYLYCLTQAYQTSTDPLWPEITVPTLIVHGTRNSMIPVTNARRLATEIPNATLTILDGANHVVVLNNHAQILAAIRSFAV